MFRKNLQENLQEKSSGKIFDPCFAQEQPDINIEHLKKEMFKIKSIPVLATSI